MKDRNVLLLALAQACYLATIMTTITFSGLAGKLLATDPKLATVPASLVIAATALSTGPMSLLMQRRSRRFGFRLGSALGVLGGLMGMVALVTASFSLLCFAMIFLGVFYSSAQYYKFAAAESVPAGHAPRAIATVLVGGLAALLIVPTLSGFMGDIFPSHLYLGAFALVTVMAGMVIVPLSFVRPLGKLSGTGEDKAVELARPLQEIVKTPQFIAAVTNAALAYAMMTFVMTATPLAMQICGFGVDASIQVIQWHTVAMFMPSLFSGWLITRLGIPRILLSGHLLFGVAVLVAVSGVSETHFMATLVLIGIGWNFCFVGGVSLLTTIHKDSEKGKVQGLNEAIVFGISAVSSLAAGLMLELYGWVVINEAIFVLLIVAILVTLWWWHDANRQKPVSDIV